MLKGYAVNQNAVASQKYEDLKRAMGLCGTDPDDCRKSHGMDTMVKVVVSLINRKNQ